MWVESDRTKRRRAGFLKSKFISERKVGYFLTREHAYVKLAKSNKTKGTFLINELNTRSANGVIMDLLRESAQLTPEDLGILEDLCTYSPSSIFDTKRSEHSIPPNKVHYSPNFTFLILNRKVYLKADELP